MLCPYVVDVFIQFLERNRNELLRKIESCATTEQLYPSGERIQGFSECLEELIAVLREGAWPLQSRPSRGFSRTAVLQNDRELIRQVLIEEAISQSVAISITDAALLSDWTFAAQLRQLREDYRRLSDLLDTTDDWLGILSTDGRVEYLNKALALHWHGVTGVPADEIAGKTIAELGLPNEDMLSQKSEELIALGRRSSSMERPYLGRWKSTAFKALYTPGEGVVGLSFAVRDIHDPRFTKIRLALLAKFSALVGSVECEDLADALATVPVPQLADWCIVHIVESGHIVRSAVSPGDPARAAVRDAIVKAFPDWEKNPLWEEMRLTSGFQLLTEVGDQLRRRIALNEEQYRLMTEMGVQSIMVLPVVSRGQTAALFTLMFTTESGRRYSHDHPPLAQELALHAGHLIENARLLRELRRNEARFRVAIAAARTVVFEHDLDLRYTWYHNPIVPIPSLMGRTDEEMLVPEEAAVLTALKWRALRGEFVRGEVAVTAGGMHTEYREALEPTRDRAGNIVGIIGAATDITEEKRAQRALQDSLVFRDRMTGVLSHDLRNPLTAIMMAVQTMRQQGERGEGDQRSLRIIDSAAKRMLEMIETLLDFTRAAYGGRLPVKRVSTDLGARAQVVVDEMRAAAPNLTIELQLQGNLSGEWDPGRIEQALSNLIANAVQYGDPLRPVRVLLDGKTDVVELRVMNEGPAIPPEVVPVLFEPFRRGVSEERTSGIVQHGSGLGLGLGLYITKQAVLAQGGEIHVESTDESGTQFSVTLPRAA
ncbi:MAG TPA: ATP-binding protein [Vicinamibacterales bacterium]